MISPIVDRIRCTGCSACMNGCPKQAIQMAPDKEGFLLPVVDQSRCIDCGLCEKTCPINHPPLCAQEAPQVFAGWHRDATVRYQSSSGGAFSAFAETILSQGGVVFGAAYAPFPAVRHIMIDSIDQLPQLRASKYVQSEIGNSFSIAKEQLDNGRKVLFVGTPCQISGLKNFLRRDYPELLTCDFACHGVPSPQFFAAYTAFLEKKAGGTFDQFHFRNKKKGWYDALRVGCLRSGKEYIAKQDDDFYFRGFNLNFSLRESCYACPAKGISRASDITIGDFWKIGTKVPFTPKKEIAKGISFIILHSRRGEQLFHAASSRLILQPRSMEEVVMGNQAMVQSMKRPSQRDTFYLDFHRQNMDAFCRHYFRGNRKAGLMALLREYCPRFMVLAFRKFITKDI